MKPVKNHVVCPACGRAKMLFESEKKAMNFIKWNADEIEDENGKAPVRAYYCTLCGGWHVTSIEELPEDYKSRTEEFVERVMKENKRKEERKAIENDTENVKAWYKQVDMALDMAEYKMERGDDNIDVKQIITFLKSRMKKYEEVKFMKDVRKRLCERIALIEESLAKSEEVDVNVITSVVSKELYEADVLFDFGMYDDVLESVSKCLLMLASCKKSMLMVDERLVLRKKARRLKWLVEKKRGTGDKKVAA